MHYVTEDELRRIYRAAPFAAYELGPDARLTPSARQFLIDFRVDFADDAALVAAAGGEDGHLEEAPAAGSEPVCSPYPAFCDDRAVLDARIALVDAELVRAVRVWEAARADMSADEAADVDSWAEGARLVHKRLCEAARRAAEAGEKDTDERGGEVRHG